MKRINPYKAAPGPMKSVLDLHKVTERLSLDPRLIELVKVRASQINGCAYCLQMHLAAARRHGEAQARLDLLAAWREAPDFSLKERAALDWTEVVTLIHESHAPDSAYERVAKVFSEQEVAELTLLIGAINLMNRLAVSLRYEVRQDVA